MSDLTRRRPIFGFALPFAGHIRHRIRFGSLIFWPLFMLTLAAVALQLGAWQTEFKIAGPFAAETNPPRASLQLQVPPDESPWWAEPLLGDDNANALQSFLEVYVTGIKIGPPHTLHETIRAGQGAGFSHWESRLIFTLPQGVNNGPETIVTLRHSVRPPIWVTLGLSVASALLGWFLFIKSLVARHGRLLARLIFWPLFMLTLAAVALELGAWYTEFKIAGPFAAETNPPRASLLVKIPPDETVPWWAQPLLGDDSTNAFQSFLEVRVNDREMGPPHTLHETIRERKNAGFSHWGNWLIFSLPPGVTNGPETIVTLRYSVRPPIWVTWGLCFASALLGWSVFIRTFAARYGGFILKGPYLVATAFCWAGLAASAIFIGCSFYAWATGWALPTTALIRWSAIGQWAADNEPYLAYLILTLAGVGTATTWFSAPSADHQLSVKSNEQSLRRVLLNCGFPIVACAFIFCVSVMWAGIVRPGDPNRINIGGLVPFSDSANYLTASYDQVKDSVWNTQALRRPLAAAFRSVLLVFGNFSLPVMLTLQACMVAAAISFATYAIMIWRGVWAGLAFFALTYIYDRFFVPTTNTEPLGMFWALLAIPFFIKAFRDRSVKAALLAFALTSVALVTRMGSMFTLPALLLWLVWQFGHTMAAKLRIFAVAICVMLGVFGFNSLLQKAYGTGSNPSTGNFAYVFCGLTMGTNFAGCMQKLESEGKLEPNEDARASQLYAMAWENLRADPQIFFDRLVLSAKTFVIELPGLIWTGYGPLEEPDWRFRAALTAISLIGLLYAARRMNAVELTFWALVWASILASSCFIYFDDGARALAASHPMMALFFAIGMSSPALAAATSPRRPLPYRYGWAGVVAAAALFMCVPWMAHRFSSIHTLVDAAPSYKEGEAFVFGGRRMTGFLVVEDGMPLRSDAPSIHLAQFETIIRESNVEFYQDLIHPVLPPLPFGFVFAPRVEKDASSLYQYIVPAEVVERRDVAAWHFDLKRWGYRPGGYGEYWFYVPKAEPWPELQNRPGDESSNGSR